MVSSSLKYSPLQQINSVQFGHKMNDPNFAMHLVKFLSIFAFVVFIIHIYKCGEPVYIILNKSIDTPCAATEAFSWR